MFVFGEDVLTMNVLLGIANMVWKEIVSSNHGSNCVVFLKKNVEIWEVVVELWPFGAN